MKKSVIFLVLLLVIPFVSSEGLSLSKEHIQLGDSFSVTGENVELNGNLYNGNAMIILDNSKDKYTLLTNIVNGNFERAASFCVSGCVLPSTPGEYNLFVSLVDSSLIEIGKVNLDKKLLVDDKYNVVVELKNVQIDPGDKVSISGSVQRNSDLGLLNSGEIKILFNGVEYKTNLVSQAFSYDFNTPLDIASNYHDVEVSVSDDKGNVGKTTTQFFVVAVPTSLTLSSDKESYLPTEKVKVAVSLLDQASDPLSQELELRIYDPKGRKMLNEIIASNQEYNFDLNEYAEPGEWLVIVKGSGLRDEKSFNVETVEKIEVNINGQYMDIVNVGNVKYTKPLEIYVEPGEFTSQRRTNLDPGKSISLALHSLLDDGEYKLTVKNIDQSFEVNVVDNRGFGEKFSDSFSGFTGQAVRKPGTGTSNTPSIIMIILFLFIIMMGYTIYKNYKVKNVNRIKFKEPKKIKDQDENFAVAQKADVEDIRDRILRNLKESRKSKKEEKVRNEEIISFKPKPVKEEKAEKVDFDQPMRRKGEEAGEDGWTYF